MGRNLILHPKEDKDNCKHYDSKIHSENSC